MADSEQTYSAGQIAIAARDLREAAGTPEERFSLEQAISMLSDEIRLLRERGFPDDRIADLFRSFEINATGEEIGKFYQQAPGRPYREA